MERTLLFIVALVAGTQAGPIQEITIGNKCADKCTVSSKFNYEPGTTYEFKYENEIRTAVQGATEDHAGLSVSATVNIDFITKCEAVMRLTDVVMKEHDPETAKMKVVSAEMKAVLEKDPLGFSFQDGHIEQICLADDQEISVLNIKRGILSMLQNNMDDISKAQTIKESDVAGTCDTEYSSADKGWYNVVVTKSKHMLSCTDRHDSKSALQGIPYDSQSKIQSLPLVKSSHNCQQEFVKQSGKLVSATCSEKHILAPFSRDSSGAITHNTQHLTFVRQSKINSKPVPGAIKASLHFDHSTSNKMTNTLQDLQDKLAEVCTTTKNGVKPETPRLFTSLIYTMKKMGASDMSYIFQKIKSKTICSGNNDRVRKFFLDAIPMTGTPASLKMMTQLLVSQEVTGIEAEMWLTTLAFIQEPSVEMLAEIKPLLTMKTNEEKAMLSVSSLVHSLCKNNPECDNYLEVRNIISLLENKIAPACKVTAASMQPTLIALRAIGNAGFGTNAIPTLRKCIMQSNNPVEVRLSAIEAFRRMPCQSDKSIIIAVFKDTEEDSEIRIAAYKTLMECPSTEVLKKIKTMLSQEEVNQVGSYVWSHLTNLMETSDPHKQAIRSILQDETLQKEFDMDKRKFSRNYEGSVFVEKINTGATIEGDMIWSSKSFIPRSAMVNLTVDLFGNAVNLLEVGGRIEGLEYFLESYFGPNGYFSDNDVQNAVDETAVQTIKADKANRINKRMNTVMDDLRGSLYMRVFGNELRYMNFDGIDSLISSSFNIFDMLMKLSQEKDYQFSHSSMFMDSSVMIPTYAGFPMNLTVNGIATIDMKASGKVDVMKMSSRPRGMDIHGTVKPSAALEVTSTMSVDALVTKVGLKMVSSLYTSTVLKGKVTLADGSILDMELDLPEDKMEILNVKSSFFTVHRDLEREQRMITENKQSSKQCTSESLARFTGIEFCGQLSYPNASMVEEAPYFPLTGPVSASVVLNKRDTLTGYKLEARSAHVRKPYSWLAVGGGSIQGFFQCTEQCNLFHAQNNLWGLPPPTSKSNILRLAFSTPKSKIDRTFGIDINLNKDEGTLDMSVESPFTKTANFAGNYQFNKKSMGVSGKVNIDNTLRYEVKAGIDVAKSGPGMLYTPTFNVKVPGQAPIDLSGSIKYAPWKIAEVDMTLRGLLKAPLKMKASYMNKLKLIRVMASAEIGKKQEYLFDASCQKIVFKKKVSYKPQMSVRTPTAEVLAFGGSYTHTFGKNLKISATLDKITSKPVVLKKAIFGVKQYSKGRKLYNVNMDLRSGPMDFKMKSKFDNRNMRTLATDIDVTYVIRKVARDNMKIVSKITNLSSKSLTKLRSSMSVSSKLNPDYNFKSLMNLDHNKKHSQIDADIKYGRDAKDTNKQIVVLVSLDKAIRNWQKASMEFNGQFRKGNDIRFVSKLKHIHDQKSLESSASVRLNKNAITASLNLKDKSTDLKQLTGQFDLSIPGKTVSLSQTINETSPSEFVSVMNARVGKALNSIKATWKRISPSALTIKADIDLYSTDKMVAEGNYNFGPKMYQISGSFVKNSKKYSASSVAEIDIGRSLQISTDIEFPSRRIIANVEQTKEDDIYSTRADLRWNADRDDSQRLVIKSKGKLAGLNNIDGSLNIQYPTRNIAINLKHFSGSKYVSHFDIQWEPSKLYSVDTVLGQYSRKDSDEIESQLKITTPFKALKTMDINLKHQIQRSEYKTKLDIEWNPKKIISGTITVKKPLTSNYVDISMVAKTPFASIRQLQTSLRHRTGKGMATVGKVAWNKQYVQVDVTLDDLSNSRQTDMKAEMNLKTSFRDLKTAKLDMAYFNDGNKLDSKLVFEQKKQTFGFISSIQHSMNGWNVNNKGQMQIFIPSEETKLIWDHSNTLNDISSSAEVTWGGNKRVFVKYSGIQSFKEYSGTLSSVLEIESSFKDLSNIVAQITHDHRRGQIDSVLKIMNGGSKVITAEGKYLRKDGEMKSSAVLTNPFSGENIEIKLESTYKTLPKSVHLEVNLTPVKRIYIDGSFNQDRNTNIDSSLSISSPNFETVMLKGTRRSTSEGIESEISFEYSPNKIIRVQSLHRLGNDKVLQIKLQSPFTSECTATVGVRGSIDNFQARGSIEALPILEKWTATGSFNKLTGMTLKVTTPFTQVPYSQITIRSEEANGDRTSSITIEYLPGKIVNFISAYNFENPRNLKLSVGLETPFAQMPKSLLEFSHRGTLERFANHIVVEYYPDNRMSIDTTFSKASGIDGTVVIAVPWTSTIKGMVKHTGSLSDFNTHSEITWGNKHTIDIKHKGSMSAFSCGMKINTGDKTMSANLDFAQGKTTTTNINLRTPMKHWENIRMAHSFEGNLKNLKNHLELFAPKYGTYSSALAMDLTNKAYGMISIQTPVKEYKNLKASLTHEGGIDNFGTRVEFQKGNEKIIGDVKLTTNPAVNFVVSIQTPVTAYQLCQLQWTHDGSLHDFKSNVQLQMNNDVSEIDISYNFMKKLNLDVAIRSPYFETVKISVDHWGKLSRFTSKIRARAGQQKMSTDIQFKLNPSLNAQISIKSPLPLLKNHQLSIKHAGSLNDFKCNMLYKCNGKTYTGEASFENINSIKGEVNMKGPGFKPMNLAFDVTATTNDIKSSLQASIGKKAVTADAFLNIQNGINGNVKISSPFEVLESMSASISHDGSFSNFKTQGEMSYNKKKGSVVVSFDNTDDLSVSVDIDTPIKNYESFTSSLRKISKISSYELLGLYKVNDKSLDFKAAYTNDTSVHVETTLNSQFSYIPNIDTSIIYNKQKISARGDITCGQQKIDFETVIDAKRYGYTGTFSTNMSWIKRITLDFNHENTGESLTSSVQTTYGGVSKFSFMSDIQYKSPINIEISIQTPLDNFETSKLSLHHSNEENSIRTEAKLELNTESHEGQLVFLKYPSIEVQVSLRSPLMKDFETSLSFDGTATNFRSQFEIKYDKESLTRNSMDLNLDGPFSGDLKIISPYVKNIKVSFNHEGKLQQFKSKAMVILAGKTTEVSVSSNLNVDPEVIIAISTPFTEDFGITFTGHGDVNNGIMTADVLYDGQSKYSLNANWNTAGSLDGEIKLQTPHAGFRQMSAMFESRGTAIDFNSKALVMFAEKKTEVTVSSNLNKDPKIVVTVSTPFSEDFGITLTGRGDLSNGIVTGDVLYDDQSKYNINANWNTAGSLDGEIKLKTPHVGFRQMSAMFEYRGKATDFNSKASVMFAGKKTEVSVSSNVGTHPELILTVTTPFSEDFGITVTGHGDLSNGIVTGDVLYAGQSKYNLKSNWNTAGSLNGEMKLKTPHAGFRQMNAMFGHQGKATDFSTKTEVSIEDQSVLAEISFSPSSGNILLKAPMIKNVEISFTNDGQFPLGQTKLRSSYGPKTILNLNMNANFPTNFEITVNFPLLSKDEMSAAIRRLPTRSGMKGHAEIYVNGQKHETDVDVNIDEQFSGQISINSPSISPIKMSVDLNIKPSAVASHGELSFGNSVQELEFNIDFKNGIEGLMYAKTTLMPDLRISCNSNDDLMNLKANADISYDHVKVFEIATETESDDHLGGSFVVKVPENEMSLAASVNGKLYKRFNGHIEAAFNSYKVEGDMSFNTVGKIEGMVDIKSSFSAPISATYSLENKQGLYTSSGEIVIDSERHTIDTEFGYRGKVFSKLSLTSPLVQPLKASATLSGNPMNFVADSELLYGDKQSRVNVLFNIQSAYEGKIDIVTPVTKPVVMSFDHKGQVTNFKTMASVKYDEETLFDAGISFSATPLQGKMEIKTTIPGYESVSASFNHDGNMLVFQQHAEIDISGDKTEFDMSLNAGSKMEGRAVAKSSYFPTIDTGFEITGTPKNFASSVDFSFDGDKYSVKTALDTSSATVATVKIFSPVDGYRTLVGTLSHTGEFPELNSQIQLKSGRRNLAMMRLQSSTSNGVTAKMTAQSVLFPTIQVNIGHKQDQTGFNSAAELKYNGISSSVNVNFQLEPSIEGSFALISPWKSSAGNFKVDVDQDSMDFKAEAGVDSKNVLIGVAYQGNKDVALTITVKTPFRNFEHLKGSAKYQNRNNGLIAEIDLELPSQEKIEFNVQSNGLTGKLSLRTPFTGLRYSSIETKYEGQFPNVIVGMSLKYSNQIYSINGEMDSTSGKLTISTPIEGFENTILAFNKQGPITNLQASLRMTVMDTETFVTLENRLTNTKLETKARLQSPFTEEDITFDLTHILTTNDMYNSMVIFLGRQNSLSTKTTLRHQGSSLELESGLSTVLRGVSDEQNIKLTFQESFPNYRLSSFAKFFGNEYSLETSLDTTTDILGIMSLKTPYSCVKSVSLKIDHKGNSRRFETKADFELNSEKLSGELTFNKYGWRKLKTAFDVKSTIDGFEHSTLSYTHTAASDSFECDVEASFLSQDFSGNLRASKAPWKVQVAMTTPFSGYQQFGADVKVDFGDGIYNTEANVAFTQDKTISLTSEINLTGSTKSLHVLFTTPFNGYETSEFHLTHSGDVMNFQSIASVSTSYLPSVRAQANLRSSSIFDFDGALVFNSQIRNLENLKFSIKTEAGRGVYKSVIESSWAPTKTFTFESVLTDKRNSMSADISLSTPFTIVRQFSLKSEAKVNGNRYMNDLMVKHEEKTIIDMNINVDTTTRKPSIVLTMREPTLMTTKVGGSFNNGMYNGHMLINDNFRIEGSHDVNTLKTDLKYNCPQHTILLNNDMNPTNPKANIYIDNERYGYEMFMTNTDATLKIILPSRSFKISGAQRQRQTEGMFMWDADNDESKMVGFKSELTRFSDSMKADITLQMPSLGKDVHIDSEMVLNRGRVIFEGKTDLKYSKDSRKTLTLTSRLLDVSNDWNTKNYSFSFGVQHPFTTVGVKLTSHLGKSKTELTGGVGVEYLTSGRETKTFSVNGELNKLRSSAKFDMDTPLKTISISGDAKMQAPFIVSLVNQYDNKQPLRTLLTLDPVAKKVDFQMNYDIDNPSSEFHINAKYVNSSAILSEIAHVVNRQKVTDGLLSLRLNSSHLLHSRLHWRPSMIADLKELIAKKSRGYKAQLSQLSEIVSESLQNELSRKTSMIKRTFQEEMRPFADILEREAERMVVMYERNTYYVRDISMAVVDYTVDAKLQYERMAKVTGEKMQYLKDITLDLSENAILSIEDMTINLLASAMPILEPVFNMTQHPTVTALRQQAHHNYVTYMETLTSLTKAVPNMADSYTSAIYNARDQITSKVASVFQRDDVKYVKSYADPVMAQGMNAYKFWEIRQNAAIIVDVVLDVIQSEIEKELSDLKASLFNLKYTRFTVYDPAQGEIQLEMHLPIPVKSLEETPVFDFAPYISKVKKYRASLPKLPQVSTDVSTWLPPFDGYATILGDHVTTFDGTEYDLDGSCSFLLAKDFVDGNFSLVLHKSGNDKSMLIMADGQAITILADGKVLVDNKVIETPTSLKSIAISNDKVETIVKGADNFEVSYLPGVDLTTIKLNGWYFGKTSGLLGTYDNEPSNDLMSSYGRPVNNPSRFARTWDMSLTKCR